MNTQELKQQAHKEFDERFEYMSGGYYASRMGRHAVHPDDFKSFLDSLIDKTVQQTEERIVEFLEQQKAKLDNCNNVDGRVQSECFKRNRQVEDWNEIIRRIHSLITNKSDINK